MAKHSQVYYNGAENNLIQDLVATAQRNLEMQSRAVALVVSPERYLNLFRCLTEDLIWPSEELRSRPLWMGATNLIPENADFMRKLFPNCRFLCLIRNGVEVVSSRMHHRSFRSGTFEQHCQTWRQSVSMVSWARQFPEIARVIRQEWFRETKMLESFFEEFWQWLELPSSIAVIQHFQEKKYHPTSDVTDLDSTFQGTQSEGVSPLKEPQQRWTEWSDSQRETFESLCGDPMHEMGYDLPWRLN